MPRTWMNTNGTLRELSGLYMNTDGNLRNCKNGWMNTNGTVRHVFIRETYSTSALTLNNIQKHCMVTGDVQSGSSISGIGTYYDTNFSAKNSSITVARPVTLTLNYSITTKNKDSWDRHAYIKVFGYDASGNVSSQLGTAGFKIAANSNTASGSLTINCSTTRGTLYKGLRLAMVVHGYEMGSGSASNIKMTAYYYA